MILACAPCPLAPESVGVLHGLPRSSAAHPWLSCGRAHTAFRHAACICAAASSWPGIPVDGAQPSSSADGTCPAGGTWGMPQESVDGICPVARCVPLLSAPCPVAPGTSVSLALVGAGGKNPPQTSLAGKLPLSPWEALQCYHTRRRASDLRLGPCPLPAAAFVPVSVFCLGPAWIPSPRCPACPSTLGSSILAASGSCPAYHLDGQSMVEQIAHIPAVLPTPPARCI